MPWSVYRQQRWNKEPRSPTGQTGTSLNVAQMLIWLSHDYRLLWKWNPTYACSTILWVWLNTARGNMEKLDLLQRERGVIWGQEAFCWENVSCFWEILLKSNYNHSTSVAVPGPFITRNVVPLAEILLVICVVCISAAPQSPSAFSYPSTDSLVLSHHWISSAATVLRRTSTSSSFSSFAPSSEWIL